MSIRVLYILPGPVPPPVDPACSEYYHIAGDISGDVLLPTWVLRAEELERSLGSFPTYQVNNFTYHMALAGHFDGTLRQKWQIFRFHVGTALKLARNHNYDCVKSYGSGLTGLTALLVAKLLRAKLIIELPNAPEDSYRFANFGDTLKYEAKHGLRRRLARRFSRAVLHIVVSSADRVHLLYPWQLQAFPKLQKVPATVVTTFAPVSKVPVRDEDGSVLLVGAPWYVKGVDVLIKAWHKIEREFPNNKLYLMGYFPEQELLREMIGDSTQIEILKARPNPEVLEFMSKCSIVVLASRTEGGPRVFVEGMAAGKPTIGSRVGGVAYYIRDGVNGFLFESENSDELAEKLRTLLASPELRAKFGKAGREIAMTEMNETTFGRRMQEMLELTVYGEVAGEGIREQAKSGAAR